MALLNSLNQFNWIDIVFVIFLIRIGYIALKSGLPAELFKSLGTVLAIYLALHYYIIFSDYFLGLIGIKKRPVEFFTSVSFIILAISGYLIFVLLRIVLSRFIHLEAVPQLNKWGSLTLGIIRSFLLVSLIIFMLAILPKDYFKNSVNNSYSGRRLFKVAPAAYTWLWNAIVSRFSAEEKFNDTIHQVQKNLTGG